MRLGSIRISIAIGLLALPPASAVEVFRDPSGHLVVRNPYLEWDVDGATTFKVRVGVEERDWRSPRGSECKQYNFCMALDESPWNYNMTGIDRPLELGPLGEFRIESPSGLEIPDDGTPVAAGDEVVLSCLTLLWGNVSNFDLNLRCTVRDDTALIPIDYQVTDPPPPGSLTIRLSLFPGGDEANDFWHWSGLGDAVPVPYGGWRSIYEGELPGGMIHNAAWDTVWRQGVAFLVDKDTTYDYPSDINYGRLGYFDTQCHSALQLFLKAHEFGRFYLLIFEPSADDVPWRPVEAMEATLSGACFLRGDASADGLFDLSDPIAALRFLFLGGSLSCCDAADVDDDGALDLTDPIFCLERLFLGGPELPPPFPMPWPDLPCGSCGPDPTPDGLDCAAYPPCG
jgi:hypothetical protein